MPFLDGGVRPVHRPAPIPLHHYRNREAGAIGQPELVRIVHSVSQNTNILPPHFVFFIVCLKDREEKHMENHTSKAGMLLKTKYILH